MHRVAHPLVLRVAVASILAAVVAGCGSLPWAVPGSNPAGSPRASSAIVGSARPSPTPKAHALAIAAFTERIAAGTLSYRLSFKGMARSSAHTLPVAGAMDVSGTDFATSFTYDWKGEAPGLGKTRVQVRSVDGRGWIKRGGARWQELKGYKLSNSYVPFKNVAAPADVRYLGSVKAGDATFHKIGVRGALLMHPNTLPYLFAKEKVNETTLEVLIDDAGRPRSGTWTMRAQARVGIEGGQLQRLDYELALTFSRVGSKISIRRP